MKKLLLVICALCFAGSAFAALDRDYFDYRQSPEFQSIPTDPNGALGTKQVQGTNALPPAPEGGYYTTDENGQTYLTTTKKVKKWVNSSGGKKRIRFGNEGSSWVNTYWNFGQPNYGETGRF